MISFQFENMYTVTRESREPERYVDPAMIGILAGMALMFIIICVVLRLFSRLVPLDGFHVATLCVSGNICPFYLLN